MNEIEQLDQLAVRMFRQYSRMEYALKAAGYLINHNGDAKADWVKLGNAIDPEFEAMSQQHGELQDAVHYLRESPPKKQIVEDGQLDWKDVKPTAPTPTSEILLYVARVRNNLFHGGKFNGMWFDPDRSLQLLPRSMVVLDTVLELSPQVRANYGY